MVKFRGEHVEPRRPANVQDGDFALGRTARFPNERGRRFTRSIASLLRYFTSRVLTPDVLASGTYGAPDSTFTLRSPVPAMLESMR